MPLIVATSRQLAGELTPFGTEPELRVNVTQEAIFCVGYSIKEKKRRKRVLTN